MSQLRKPLTAGAVDEYVNHLKTRLVAGDNAAQLETQLQTFDSDAAGAVVKQRLAQVIAGLKNTRALSNGQVSASINAAGTGYAVGDVIPVSGDIGDIASTSIDTAGTGYQVGDAIAVTGDGSGADIEVATVGGSGEITGLTVNDAGSGYTTITLDASGVGNGDAELSATLNPVDGNGCAIRVTSVGGSGEITGIEVSGGEGYVATATADTSGVGNEDATFTFTISNELNVVETMAASIEAAS